MAQPQRISITICGDGGCGKSSITLRLVRSAWTSEYDPTIEDSYSVTRTIDGIPVLLSLTDTAGQEEYRGLISSSSLASDAFLLVYDITNPESLQSQLPYFLDMVEQERDTRAEGVQRPGAAHQAEFAGAEPVVIVAGNKCDLKNDRKITAREGLEWARQRNCGFMETSAKECVNVEETFALIVRRVRESREAYKLQQSGGAPPAGAASRTAGGHRSKHGSRDLSGNVGSEGDAAYSTSAPMGPFDEKRELDAAAGTPRQKGWWWKWAKCW